MRVRVPAVLLAFCLLGIASIPASADPSTSVTPSPAVEPTTTPEPEPATPSPIASTAPTSSPSPTPAQTRTGTRTGTPHWIQRIDRLVAGRQISVSIGFQDAFLYRHRASVRRAPASNEKLLLSMATLDTIGPDATIATTAGATAAPVDGVVEGDVWIRGHGDPGVGRSTMADLARQIVSAGVTRIHGRVYGSTRYFAHDWFAPGWRADFPANDVALPSALTFEGNVGPGGAHIRDPELRAARSLTKQLEARDVRVSGRAGAGRAPNGLTDLSTATSPPMHALLRKMNVDSLNFYAEVLGKGLGVATDGTPGTIAKGASAIEAYERSNGVRRFSNFDGSGLSYDDRATTVGVVRLLWIADAQSWLKDLRLALPRAGQGTLEGRLGGLKVRAKTGTLTSISALSGWVWLEKRSAWAEFSILSRGMAKSTAIRIEDAIVASVANNAR